MELPQEPFYCIRINNLKNVNPLSNMKDLLIYPNKFSVPRGTSLAPISRNNPLFTNKGLAFKLAAIKFVTDPDSEKSKQTLEAISTTVSLGVPVTSNHFFTIHYDEQCFEIFSRSTQFSIFQEIEAWVKKDRQINSKTVSQLMITIFQGEQKRKERLAYIHNGLEIDLYNKPEVQLPESLILMLLSYLPKDNVDKKRTKLIEKAKEKFYKEQPLQLNLDEE